MNRNLQSALTAVIVSLKALLSPVAFGVSAIALDGKGHALLVRHRYMPGWHLPGGGVGRGEPPADAIIRELQEEVGMVSNSAPQFAGLFTRKLGIATNVIALYCIRNVQIEFKPNAEIAAAQFSDPAHPPPGTAAGSARRLAEFVNKTLPAAYW